MNVKAGEVSAVILKQLSGYENEVDIYDIGTVLSVGDNVARVYGLSKCQASELIEFPHGVFGVALNLEEDNVGCVLFGEVHLVKEGDTVKAMRFNGQVISIELSKNVYLEVTYAEDVVKGDTSSAITKDAKLETGITVRVPAFIKIGDIISVDTETGAYRERKK